MKFTTIAQAKKQANLSYIGGINISAKLKKNKKVSGTLTYCIYFAPANTSGYNVCSHSTPECRLGCLATSGRAGMELIAGKTRTKDCRIRKTRLFYEQPEFFMEWLIAEIRKYQNKANKDGYKFSVRLNGTSDIDWANVYHNGKNVFEIFPDVVFYDYTKNPDKYNNKPENYHLTFSYTGRNWYLCKALLEQRNNVTVIFKTKHEIDLPKYFMNYLVINGDITDSRIDDAKGIIVGLKFKHIANKEAEKQVLNSIFVVRENNINN
jgi:hypothetical protein